MKHTVLQMSVAWGPEVEGFTGELCPRALELNLMSLTPTSSHQIQESAGQMETERGPDSRGWRAMRLKRHHPDIPPVAIFITVIMKLVSDGLVQFLTRRTGDIIGALSRKEMLHEAIKNGSLKAWVSP